MKTDKRFLYTSSSLVRASVAALAFFTPFVAHANPQDGVVVGGSATILSTGSKLDITQHTDRAVIDWRTFNIAPGEHTQFYQPSASSIVLNRVNDINPSAIFGQLSANGNVIILNPNGVLFGAGSRIDVNGLVATTAGISNGNFMTGGLHFNQPGNPNAAIVNEGEIHAAAGGLVGLVAPGVLNNGIITADLGRVHLASGDTVTLDFYGDKLLEVAVSDAVKTQIVANTGSITANGGKIALTAAAGSQVVDSLIVAKGELKAPAVTQKGGEIIIHAAGANKTGKSGASYVTVQADIDVSGRMAGQSGGSIKVLGDEIAILDGTRMNASGHSGKAGTTAGLEVSAHRDGSAGGSILIGGDYLGQGDTPTARNLSVGTFTLFYNDALAQGDAGRTIFWSDGDTDFRGNVYARALGYDGMGGFVETSGHNNLNAQGFVDLSSVNGEKGTYFLDPTNISIFGNVAPNFNSTDGSTITLSSTLKTWFDASDTASVNLTYVSMGSTASGTSGTKTITVSANTGLYVGARIRLGAAGSVTAASTQGADTYTITNIAGGTITVAENLTTTYVGGTGVYQGYISQLTDKSGLNNHAAQADTTKMPLWISNGLNGQGSILWAPNSTVTMMTFAGGNPMTGSTAGSMFTSLKADTAAGSSGLASAWGGWGSSGAYNHYAWSNGIVYEDWGSTARPSFGDPTADLSATHLYNIVSAAASYKGNINGANISSSGTNTVGWGANPVMGAGALAGAYFFRGRMGDFVAYGEAVSVDEQDLMNQYQSAKWGVAITPYGTGATEVAKATASDGYSVFTTRYLERLSQSANISLQATNDINLDLKGDTLAFTTSGRSLTLTAGNQIVSKSTGTITTNNGAIALNATNGIVLAHDYTYNSGGAAINFNNKVDGAGNLTTNSGAGTTTFAAALGGSTPIGTLDVTGPAALGGNITTNNKNITFSSTLSLTGSSTMNAGTGTIKFGGNASSAVSGASDLTMTAKTFWLNGGWLGTPTNLFGNLSITSTDLLDLNATFVQGDIFARTTGAASDLRIGSTIGVYNANSTITLVAGRHFRQFAGGGIAFNGGAGGKWLIYSTNPANNLLWTGNELTADYRRFSCTYGGSCPTLGAGNGFLYSYTPTLTATPAAAGIIYGDASPVTGYGYALSGYLGSDSSADNVTGSLNGTSTYSQGSNAGTYNINYSAGALTSDMGYGFTYANNATALTVAKKNITASWTAPLSRTYGDANPSVDYNNFSFTGLYGADNASLFSSITPNWGGVDANTNVGTHAITATIAATTNYNVTNTPGTNLTINARALTVGTDAQSITYGDAAPTYTGSNNLTAYDAALITWAYAPAGYAGNAGTYQITATATDAGSRLANYTRTNSYNNLTVAKKDITAAWTASLSRTYGDANPSVDYNNFTFTGLVSGDLASLFSSITPDFSLVGSNVGTYNIAASIAATTNYNVTNTPASTLAITKKNITAAFTAPFTRAYGAANPTVDYNNFNFAGLVGGDPASLFTDITTGFGGAGPTSTGLYTVSSVFGDTANYHFTGAAATTLTITGGAPVTSLPSTVVWVSQNQTFTPPPTIRPPAILVEEPSKPQSSPAAENTASAESDGAPASVPVAQKDDVSAAGSGLTSLRGLMEIDPELAKEIGVTGFGNFEQN